MIDDTPLGQLSSTGLDEIRKIMHTREGFALIDLTNGNSWPGPGDLSHTTLPEHLPVGSADDANGAPDGPPTMSPPGPDHDERPLSANEPESGGQLPLLPPAFIPPRQPTPERQPPSPDVPETNLGTIVRVTPQSCVAIIAGRCKTLSIPHTLHNIITYSFCHGCALILQYMSPSNTLHGVSFYDLEARVADPKHPCWRRDQIP